MQIPPYFLPRPDLDMTRDKKAAFDEMFKETAADPGKEIDYRLPYPKWQFLCYLGETHGVALHGTQNNVIDTLEPRQPQDIREFSNQKAIYATPDGIWSMFFAILDRKQYPMSLVNSCVRVRLTSDTFSAPIYYFSITRSALEHQPWCTGTVYILPGVNFEAEPPQQFRGMEIDLSHWVCRSACRPIARLQVGSQDFPFLAQIRGHDDEILFARAKADPDGFPWPED